MPRAQEDGLKFGRFRVCPIAESPIILWSELFDSRRYESDATVGNLFSSFIRFPEVSPKPLYLRLRGMKFLNWAPLATLELPRDDEEHMWV